MTQRMFIFIGKVYSLKVFDAEYKQQTFSKLTASMTVDTNDIKMNIINIITRMEDIDELERIYDSLEKGLADSSEKPDIKDAIVKIREGMSYKEILAEQNYKPISYDEFRKLADKIEWDHSLEELLAELD